MGVAEIIRDQIGPMAFAMMGTKGDIWGDKDCLIFKIRGSKRWSRIKISLSPLDTYRVEFFKINPKTYDITSEAFNDIYVEDLHNLIERETGLYLSLKVRT